MQLKEKINKLPDTWGVYLMKDGNNHVIYVGKAASLKKRVSSYFRTKQGSESAAADEGSSFQRTKDKFPRLSLLVSKVKDIEYISAKSELEALTLEYSLIKKYRPFFNIHFKDDKKYPYIEITASDRFPAVRITRRLTNLQNYFFGPYTSPKRLKEIINLIKKIFQVRTCKLKISEKKVQKECLDYQINQCSAPCSRKINSKEYMKNVQSVICFLKGHTQKLINYLKEEIKKESKKLNYEKCAELKRKLDSINYYSRRQKTYFKQPVEADFIGLGSVNQITHLVVFQIREGKLIEEKRFLLENNIEENFLPRAAARKNFRSFKSLQQWLPVVRGEQQLLFFLQNYYTEKVFTPPKIYLPVELPQGNILERFLKRLTGFKIKFITPAKGRNLQLIKEACGKAALNLNKHLSSFGFEEKRKNPELKLEVSSQRGKFIQPVTFHPRAEARGIQGDPLINTLKKIQQIFRLKKIPLRIEALDISNIQGKHSTGSTVVFKEGKPLKSDYRHYKVKSINKPDDCAMISEILQRRLLKKEKLPDLLLIDGGRAQLNTALKVLRENNLSSLRVITLAKKEELVFVDFKKEPLNLRKSPEVLHLLMHIRDEAHRIAVKLHRKVRLSSVLSISSFHHSRKGNL